MDFLLKEGRHSLEAYADHASFVMFGLGNEMNGDEGLAELLDAFKKSCWMLSRRMILVHSMRLAQIII